MSHFWFVMRWLHILAMAFFVGGQLFLAAVVVPAERRAPDRERLRAIARRFGYANGYGLRRHPGAIAPAWRRDVAHRASRELSSRPDGRYPAKESAAAGAAHPRMRKPRDAPLERAR